MEFNRRGISSEIWKGVYSEASLVTREDVIKSFQNEYLHDQHSHFIVAEEGKYDDTRAFIYGIVPDRIKKLEEAYNDGKTIVVKEMENWNEQIKKRCREFSGFTDVHMYVSPAGATGFGWHTDDKDVYVHMQVGRKSFEVEEPDGKISSYTVEAGDVLFIPYGARHRAIAAETSSIHLGFGVWPKDISIEEEYTTFPIEVNIEL